MGQIFHLFFSFVSNVKLPVVLDGNSSQKYRVDAGVHKVPFFVLHSSYYTLMTFLMMLSVILLLSTLMILHSKCDQAYDLWQQLVLASELESDLRDTVDYGRW